MSNAPFAAFERALIENPTDEKEREEANVMAAQSRMAIRERKTMTDDFSPTEIKYRTLDDTNIVRQFTRLLVTPNGRVHILNSSVFDWLRLASNETMAEVASSSIFVFQDRPLAPLLAKLALAVKSEVSKRPELQIKFNVEINPLLHVAENDLEFIQLKECEEPHGKHKDRAVDMEWRAEKLLRAVAKLPKRNIVLYVNFHCIWRNFRILRALSYENGVPDFLAVYFRFGNLHESFNREDICAEWHIRQTMAAVNDVDIEDHDRSKYTPELIEKLEGLGCRGFHLILPSKEEDVIMGM